MRDRDQRLTWLAVSAAAVTVALTAAAFWLSYQHLHDIAHTNGLNDPARSWAWPATVDLFIVAGELLLLRGSLTSTGVDWWAVAMVATGSLGSIALNVAGVGADAPPLEYVVAAVPPVAALLAFGALMRQLHAVLTPPATAAAPEPVPAPAAPCAPVPPLAVPPGARPLPIVTRPEPRPEPVPVPAPADRPVPPDTGTGDRAARPPARTGARQPHAGAGTGTFAEHVAQARHWLATDPGLTGTAIGRQLGTGDSYGRRIRRAALAPPEPVPA